jgi:hypothetical protein
MRWRDLWRFFGGPTVEDLTQAAAPLLPPLPTDRREIAAAAKALLEDPVFQLALSRVQERLAETWKTTETADMPRREEMYRLHWAIEELRTELRRMVDNARVPQGLNPAEERE